MMPARANLGLSEPKWLTGIMPTTLALTGRRFHFDEAALKADLTNAAAEIPSIQSCQTCWCAGERHGAAAFRR